MQILNIAGSKKRIAPWIISHFGSHQIYVEPYGGSAAVLIAKEAAPLEIYNDIDRELILFFQTLCSRPEELLARIDRSLYSSVIDASETSDIVELARRFFVRNNTTWTHSGAFKSQSRVTEVTRTVATVFEERKGHLTRIAERIRRVIFESRDALEIIKKYDGPQTLFYVDPPYYGTRKANLYRHEMMDEQKHRELAEVLHSVQGSVVLSGYPSELYKELYGGWQFESHLALTNSKAMRQECLWIKATGKINGVDKHRRKTKWDPKILKIVANSTHGLSYTEIRNRVKSPESSLSDALERLKSQKQIYQNEITKNWIVTKYAG